MNIQSKIEDYLINNCGVLKIDSNEIKQGDVFVALQGNNFHGNMFIKQALTNGAKYIITDKLINKKKFHNMAQVSDTILFLLNIAKKKRNIFKGKIISITGSIGKTSVKEALKYFLSDSKNVSASIKSYNNLLGVIVSLVNLDLNSDFAVFEVGTNNFNEIVKLAKIVIPHQVIITNIFPTHLENFKNTRNIAIEKSDLFNPQFNPNIELLVLPNYNDDEKYLYKLSKKFNIRKVITFGKKNNSDYCIQSIIVKDNYLSKIEIKTLNKLIKFKTSTFIEHHIINIIISIIIFEYNRITIQKLLKLAFNLSLTEGRGLINRIKLNNKSVTLIDESYNASPVSMLNCINYLDNFKLKKNQRKILILGEMNELGENTMEYHKEIVFSALKTKIDILIFCGNFYKSILKKISFNSSRIFYLSNELEIINNLENNTHNDDIILAKCSNSTIINKLVKNLLINKKET